MDLAHLGLISVLSVGGAFFTYWAIPQVKAMFIKAGMAGIDLCKKDRTTKMYV